MQIRFAELKDVPGILSLLRQVGQVHHLGRPDIFRSGAQKYSASQVISLIDDENTPIFVAVEGEKLLGYCFCMRKKIQDDPVLADCTSLYIDDLCIDENCRGQHIGTALYNEVCRYAKAIGCYNITLNVWACNPSAMRFYEHLGMQVQKIGMETLL